jgi:hypothetical protein
VPDLGPVVAVEGGGDEVSTGYEHMKKIPASLSIQVKARINDHQSLKWHDRQEASRVVEPDSHIRY